MVLVRFMFSDLPGTKKSVLRELLPWLCLAWQGVTSLSANINLAGIDVTGLSLLSVFVVKFSLKLFKAQLLVVGGHNGEVCGGSPWLSLHNTYWLLLTPSDLSLSQHCLAPPSLTTQTQYQPERNSKTIISILTWLILSGFLKKDHVLCRWMGEMGEMWEMWDWTR